MTAVSSSSSNLLIEDFLQKTKGCVEGKKYAITNCLHIVPRATLYDKKKPLCTACYKKITKHASEDLLNDLIEKINALKNGYDRANAPYTGESKEPTLAQIAKETTLAAQREQKQKCLARIHENAKGKILEAAQNGKSQVILGSIYSSNEPWLKNDRELKQFCEEVSKICNIEIFYVTLSTSGTSEIEKAEVVASW